MKSFWLVLLVVFFLIGLPQLGFVEEPSPFPLRGVIHVHTRVSSGAQSLAEYPELAKRSGVDVLVATDTLQEKVTYGLWPFRSLIKYTVEHSSVLQFGIQRYLALVNETNRNEEGILVVEGVACNPLYYWTGSPWKKTLILHDRGKDLLVVGLGRADAYGSLPTVANGKLKFNPYKGQGMDQAYQQFIDDAVGKGGLVFWPHPEARENLKWQGVLSQTVPDPELLLRTHGYTGFGIFYEGYKQVGKPGGIWDRILAEYCGGKRQRPVWAVGEVDWRGGEKEKRQFDSVTTTFFVRDRSREAVLQAMRSGQMSAEKKSRLGVRVFLNQFWVEDLVSGRRAEMGEEMIVKGTPRLRFSVSSQPQPDQAYRVKIIRGGEVIHEESLPTPIDLTYDDPAPKRGVKTYYRLDIHSKDNAHLISNPIFVTVEEERRDNGLR